MDKYQLLERCYGYRQFRPGQEQLIDGALSGRDVFGIMPTGGGKSVCYQLPALMLPGITLVVSPLISLMRDQVMALKAMGIPAAYINSTLSAEQMRAVYRNLLARRYKIVYVAPERLDYGGFSGVVSQLDVSFIAVDEAHCISQWGQDFRPSYLRITDFIQSLPRRPVVGAFTATATAQVREDIVRLLGLQEPVQITTGFDRPNLYFDVLQPTDKDGELLRLLEGRKNKCGIVYCATRKNVEKVCELLLDNGYAATRYHAGLDEQERTENQEDFLYDRKTVMVATNAFGMGIDKSNVSYVIHYNMPKSLEAYYQEAGRAGRDGAAAECVLLFGEKDVHTAKFLINNASENDELTPEQRELVREQDLVRLGHMVAYCRSKECLRGCILEYFGQEHPETCGACGTCDKEYVPTDITRQAQMVLSCVRRVRDKLGVCVGVTMLAKTLQGSKEKAILEKGLHELSTYGLLSEMGRSRIREIILHLEQQGYLHTDTEYDTLELTRKAGEVLFRGENVTMLVRKEEPLVSAPKKKTVSDGDLTGPAAELYEELRILRAEIAREEGVPAYVVFSNATLVDMARKMPKNTTEFRRVSGVGEMKAQWYSARFLKVLRQFRKEH
ncbi:MAG: DNA helicase RecQ [Oscillospiraceae bacterium]|nr:DNA helicase RecQ [Oscillospiraceae bacterium]